MSIPRFAACLEASAQKYVCSLFSITTGLASAAPVWSYCRQFSCRVFHVVIGAHNLLLNRIRGSPLAATSRTDIPSIRSLHLVCCHRLKKLLIVPSTGAHLAFLGVIFSSRNWLTR